jgi:cell division protein FtsA
MAVTDFIAAIELGSSKITGIAGKKNADGSIQILAYASEHSSDCIKKGIIYNLDKTTQCLTSVIQRLEDQLQASIKKVYVGIGGQSLRSIRNIETKQLGEEVKISQALIDELMKSNCSMNLIDQEILAVEPQEYKVGNQLTTEPVGIPTEHIEGHYVNIIARNALKSNIRQCFRQAGCEVADYLLSPLVTANVVLTESEKRAGCALVDFGADTTTVSVYKNNLLRHVAVIPLGSSNITKDIASLQIEEEDAEQLKLNYASAYTESAEEEDMNQEYVLDGRCSIRARKLEDIVEARTAEILENAWNQIKLSGHGNELNAGIVITGGASRLPNLCKAFTAITKIDKIRIAQSGNVELKDEEQYVTPNGSQNTLIGLLAAGKENCCKIDPHKSQLSWLQQQEEEEEAKKKAEEERKRKEEEAKRLKAEAERKKQLEEERIRQEQERAQKRLRDCEALIAEAKRLAERKKYKDALAKIEEAQDLKISEKMQELNDLRAAISQQKSDNNPLKRLINILKNEADEMMKGEN